MRDVGIDNFHIGKKRQLALICGPCVMESDEIVFSTAQFLKNLSDKLGIPLIFKSSYDKANRSSVHSFRGPGLNRGLSLLGAVKKSLNIPVTTDVHSPEQAKAAGEVCDIIQIPAFLCRQTDLIVAAAETGKVVNVKKGQFLAPWDMANVITKIEETGNHKIILTDRGTSFGYNNLVSDMRAIPIMQDLGYPVCYDATHSVQLPGGRGTSSGGERKHIETLASAAVAAGCDCVFIEAHPNPSEAKSDKETQVPLDELEPLLQKLLRLREVMLEVQADV